MNPLTGALKFFSTTTFNSIVALIFFLLAGRLVTPDFVGKIAIIQLVETIAGSFLSLMPYNLITREISHNYATHSQKLKDIISTSLTFPILISPSLFFLFFFPSYLWFSIPYFFLYFYSSYQQAVLSGLGKFTEVNLANVIFTITRWGLSAISLFFKNIELLILIWSFGSLIKVIYLQKFLGFNFKFHKEIAKDVIKFGFPIYLYGIISFISGQGDRVLTTYFLGSYELGIYQLVALASTVSLIVVSNLTNNALTPSSTYYYSKGKDITKMSSMTLRFYVIFSLPLSVIGYALTPLFITHLFPQYVTGISSMQILILTFTSLSPLQSLSSFLVAVKKDYRPFLIIGTISALEVISLSALLIPEFGILGAAVSQAVNVVLTSLLFLYYALAQGVLTLGKDEVKALVAIPLVLLCFLSWEFALALVLLYIKFSGLIYKDEVSVTLSFLPKQLRFFGKILYLFSK
ncbi:MAG: oligosaccharide flippase family protein [Ignisphaera sp.]